MDAKVIILHYCDDCRDDFESDYPVSECPYCHGQRIHRERHLICECGQYLQPCGYNTNECPSCGKLYNDFGNELAPEEEWDEEDHYGSFGLSEEE